MAATPQSGLLCVEHMRSRGAPINAQLVVDGNSLCRPCAREVIGEPTEASEPETTGDVFERQRSR